MWGEFVVLGAPDERKVRLKNGCMAGWREIRLQEHLLTRAPRFGVHVELGGMHYREFPCVAGWGFVRFLRVAVQFAVEK